MTATVAPGPPADPAASVATDGLTPTSPFVRRFAAWSAERFPPAVGILAAALFVDAVLIGSGAGGRRWLAIGPAGIAGFLAFWSYLLVLRIYDEHKDAESDRIVHPERLTVTGVMPLSQLRLVLVVVLVLQGGVSLSFDRGVGAVTVTWLAATAWSLLMLREFFVPAWLRSHPVPYALSHAVATPLMVLWAFEMGTHGPGPRPAATSGPGELFRSGAAWSYVVLALAASLLFELSRKVRAPEDERDGDASYATLFGIGRSAVIGCALLAIMATAALGVAVGADGAGGGVVVVTVVAAAVLAAGCIPFVRFARRPTRRRASAIELGSGLASLALLVAVGVALIAHGGLTWH